MKALVLTLLVLSSFTASAHPLVTVKDRLRLDLWFNGLEVQQPVKTKVQQRPTLPEELERSLRKI